MAFLTGPIMTRTQISVVRGWGLRTTIQCWFTGRLNQRLSFVCGTGFVLIISWLYLSGCWNGRSPDTDISQSKWKWWSKSKFISTLFMVTCCLCSHSNGQIFNLFQENLSVWMFHWHGNTLTAWKFRSLVVQISMWTEQKYWMVLCERSVPSNFSAGKKNLSSAMWMYPCLTAGFYFKFFLLKITAKPKWMRLAKVVENVG